MPTAVVQTEEEEIKAILLELVEPNRDDPTDIIPPNVTGWRFPSEKKSSDASSLQTGDEQYRRPVCNWTGVICDPIDGSITGLNLGDGFYVGSLLGIYGGDVGADRMDLRRNEEIILHKRRRYAEAAPTMANARRADDVSTTSPTTEIIGPIFPSSIGKLRSLRFINLSSNKLRGGVPNSVLQLPNLQIVDVSMNDLDGTFPHFESEKMLSLDISKNRFHGPLPEHVFGHPEIDSTTAPYLRSVVKFDISHNSFNGTIPLDGTSAYYDQIAMHDEALQNLKYFDLGFNIFTGTICNNIGNFASLEGLFLEHNLLVGTIPKSIFRESGPLPLTQLYLQQNLLSGTLSDGIDRLVNLVELYVDGNKLTGPIPKALCDSGFNLPFLIDTQTEHECDAISCPVNSASREGVAPCTPCPDDGGFNRYIGQHNDECRGAMSEIQILDLFYESLHGDEWLDSSYHWKKASPACQRRGVECNEQGQVTEIVLPSLGLRGHLRPEIGFLSKLQVLDLRNNQLKGFLPSDLRFAPLKLLDLRGSRLQGVVPPLLCIQEGINGNGVGPPGTDINLLYACENIICPKRTYSSIGRASLPENEGEDGIQCLPCYDDHAALYMGRDQCSDIFLLKMQIRRVDAQKRLLESFSIILALIVVCLCAMRCRRKILRNAIWADDTGDLVLEENDDNDHDELHSSLPVQRWLSQPVHEAEYTVDDWTVAYSDREDSRPMNRSMELSMIRSTRSRFPDII
ncbi:hypothetical protein ACHAXA_000306 [Cyclostephanos tholiformis]|uniref:Uncharacterized protein n=1 Tax=Cyclostephanos tholiformis TaxID=382380 RepID=A0ABD3RRL7_9STRA